jgi:hypothetical protein
MDRFPTGYTKAVRWNELATVHRDLGPGLDGDKGVLILKAYPTAGTAMAAAGSGFVVDVPSTQTAYVTTEGTRWQTEMWLGPDEFTTLARLDSPLHTYRSGGTYRERYNYPVFGPGLPQIGYLPAFRRADWIASNLPLFTDSSGNAGFTYPPASSTKLYLDGQLVGENQYPGIADFDGLPTAPGKYRLTTEVANPERFAPTTSVSAEWTFTSSYVDEKTAVPLPVNVVRFLPKLSDDGTAPRRQAVFSPPENAERDGHVRAAKQSDSRGVVRRRQDVATSPGDP